MSEPRDELELFARVRGLKRSKVKGAKKGQPTDAGQASRKPTKVKASPETAAADSVSATPQPAPDANGLDLVSKVPDDEGVTWKFVAERIVLHGTQGCVWSYGVAIVLLWIVMRFTADRWWLFTVLLYGPRSLIGLPLIALIPLAAVVRARLLLVLVPITPLVLFGIIGLRIPWPGQAVDDETRVTLTAMTCNTGGNAADWNQIRRLLNTKQPHVIALQETLSSRLEAIPESWRTRHDGRLAIASCYPIAEFRSWCPEQPRQPWSRVVAVYARLDTPDGPVGVCNVHLMPPHEALANLFDPQEHFTVEDRARLTQQNLERNRESESLAEWIRNLPQLDVVLGGFNMPVESCIYRRWWKSYHNAYSRVGFGTGSTITRKWHNIRFGTRVDHVLTTDNWSPTACQVGPDIGSDHRPVTATLAREG